MKFLPNKKFPPYAFIPGENPHPKKSGGHMEGEGDPIASPLDPIHPDKNEFFLFGLDLFNHKYYWESHVYFEALWNAHGREGSVADFLKGLIKLGAAGVKLSIHQKNHAFEHFLRAKELFESVRKTEGPTFLGFDLDLLIAQVSFTSSQEVQCFTLGPKIHGVL